MADHISPEEIRRRLILFLHIPNETWTDVLKPLSRRILVQKISPTCYRLKEICNENVKSVHVIEEAERFTGKLGEDDPEAIEELEHLAGNGCELAEQFRFLDHFWINNERSVAILRHCPEFFYGRQIDLHFDPHNRSSTFFMHSLDQLERANAINKICVSQEADQLWLIFYCSVGVLPLSSCR